MSSEVNIQGWDEFGGRFSAFEDKGVEESSMGSQEVEEERGVSLGSLSCHVNHPEVGSQAFSVAQT